MPWHGMVWYGMLWYCMVWYGMGGCVAGHVDCIWGTHCRLGASMQSGQAAPVVIQISQQHPPVRQRQSYSDITTTRPVTQRQRHQDFLPQCL